MTKRKDIRELRLPDLFENTEEYTNGTRIRNTACMPE